MAANSQPACESAGQGLWSALPPPSAPTALLLRQNHFQAALLCSQRCSSALCVLGEGSSAGRETAGTVNSTTARSPFWKGYLVTDILIPICLSCRITLLHVLCVHCFLLSCQASKLSDSHMDSRGRRSDLFFVSWMSEAGKESYLKWRSTERGSIWVFFSLSQR